MMGRGAAIVTLNAELPCFMDHLDVVEQKMNACGLYIPLMAVRGTVRWFYFLVSETVR